MDEDQTLFLMTGRKSSRDVFSSAGTAVGRAMTVVECSLGTHFTSNLVKGQE